MFILRHFLYLSYLCPCLDLGLLVSYLCDLFFIFIMINRIILFENRRTCSFAYFLEYVLLILHDNVDEESEQFSNSKSSASRCCLAIA